jgi:Flp pilus assembly protein CpaB
MRGRLLILVGLIILLVVIVLVVVVNGGVGGGGNPPPPAATDAGTGQVVDVPTAGPTPTPIPFVNIAIVLQNLPRGYRFPNKIDELKNVVNYAPWPESAVPFNALKESEGGLETLLGKVARTDLFREQPMLTTLVVDDLTQIANVGSDVAAVLPPDRVAVALPVDRVTSVAYGIADGDRVDILVSMLFVDVDPAFQSISPNNITLVNTNPTDGSIQFIQPITGRPDVISLGQAIIGPSERQRPRLVSQRTIQDAIVIHVGDIPVDGKFIGKPPTPTPVPQDQTDQGGGNGTPPPPPTPIPRPDIVVLGVSPQEAAVITWAIEARLPLTLAIRSAQDTSRGTTTPVTLDYLLSTYNITVPAKKDYTIEPAIRSIRQLLAAPTISIDSDPRLQASANGGNSGGGG